MKRYANLDVDIIKYNKLQYADDRIEISFKTISEIIGYNGSDFRKDIVNQDDVRVVSNELGISYPLNKGVAVKYL